MRRRIVLDRAGQKCSLSGHERAKFLQLRRDVLRVRKRLQLIEQARQRRQASRQRRQIARPSRPTATRPMTRSISQTFSNCSTSALSAAGDSSSAATAPAGADVFDVAQRIAEPLPQQSPAQAGAGAVHGGRSEPSVELERTVRSISMLRSWPGRC